MTTATAESIDWMTVGHALTSHDQFDMLPVGTRLETLSGGGKYVKREDGWWDEVANRIRPVRDYFNANSANKITFLPHMLKAGDAISGEAAFAECPVGAVILCHSNPPKRFTKVGRDTWRQDGRTRERRDRWFSSDHRHTVESLPDGAVVLSVNSMGSRPVSTVGELAGLDANTLVTVTNQNGVKVTWTTNGDGMLTMNDGGSQLPAVHFQQALERGHVTLGVVPEVGQCYSEGSTTYLLVERAARGWYMAMFAGPRWHSVLNRVDPPGTLAATPEWLTDSVRTAASAAVAQKRAYDEMMKLAEERRAEITKGEQAKEALRSAFARIERGKVDPEELRSFIDGTLSEHGIKPLDETVTVTTTASITQYVRIPGDTLRPHVEQATADSTVKEARVPVTFTRAFDTEVTVESGQCGCAMVGNTRLRDWVREEGFTDLYSHSISKRVCTSENCSWRDTDPF